jgi:hypothetical protein
MIFASRQQQPFGQTFNMFTSLLLPTNTKFVLHLLAYLVQRPDNENARHSTTNRLLTRFRKENVARKRHPPRCRASNRKVAYN